METRSEKPQHIIDLIFKGIAVAMGVAVVVTGLLGAATVGAQVIMLGIGLSSLAIASLDQHECSWVQMDPQ